MNVQSRPSRLIEIAKGAPVSLTAVACSAVGCEQAILVTDNPNAAQFRVIVERIGWKSGACGVRWFCPACVKRAAASAAAKNN